MDMDPLRAGRPAVCVCNEGSYCNGFHVLGDPAYPLKIAIKMLKQQIKPPQDGNG